MLHLLLNLISSRRLKTLYVFDGVETQSEGDPNNTFALERFSSPP